MSDFADGVAFGVSWLALRMGLTDAEAQALVRDAIPVVRDVAGLGPRRTQEGPPRPVASESATCASAVTAAHAATPRQPVFSQPTPISKSPKHGPKKAKRTHGK